MAENFPKRNLIIRTHVNMVELFIFHKKLC